MDIFTAFYILGGMFMGFAIADSMYRSNATGFPHVKTIRDFAREVSKYEGGKVNLPIAQISEVLRVINDRTNGEFYKFIKGVK